MIGVVCTNSELVNREFGQNDGSWMEGQENKSLDQHWKKEAIQNALNGVVNLNKTIHKR